MNPQLTSALVQTRQQELRRAAESARIAGGITSRPNPLTQLLRHIPAPRLNLRVLRAGKARDAVNQA